MEDLNTSDHLPLIADMMYSPVFKVPDPISIKIDWRLAILSGDIETYRNTVADQLNRMASNGYECIEKVEKELNFVCNLLFDSAQRTLPHVRQSQRQRWNDSTLTTVCSESRQVRNAWKKAGTPAEGPIYDEKCRLRRAVRKRIRFCAAQAENRKSSKEEQPICIQS